MDIDHYNAPDDPDPNNQTTSDDSSSISSDSSAEFDEIISRSRRRRLVAVMTMSIVAAAMEVAKGLYDKEPYHTSLLSGHAWVLELRNGHPDRIRCELGVTHHVFDLLLSDLRGMGYKDSKHVTLEEQLAIFLYTCVTGLSIRHVGERFQRANDTIAKYFKTMLTAFSSAPFYDSQVSLPRISDPIPPEIRDNPKRYPFFKDALGVINGTHINCSPSEQERQAARNRKGLLTQNCLMACSFDLRFLYVLSGWEGSAADSLVFHNTRFTSFPIPQGKYYLADAGFPLCDQLLVPYRGVRYHLAEWGRANIRPANKEELFNLRHASARNVIERIFGVLERRFRILACPPEYSMEIQAQIPAALCALHNFIRHSDPTEIDDDPDATDLASNCANGAEVGDLATQAINAAERVRMSAKRDQIAQDMWDSYILWVQRGVPAVRSGVVDHAEPSGSTSQMIGEPITSEDPPAQGWENADDNIAPPTLPPPTPSPSKRRFSTLASESIDSSSQSAIPSPSTAITGGSPISRSAVSSSSGRAKRGRMTGAIAISSLGHELSDIKGLLRMEIESTKSNLDAREERKRWEMERSEHNHPRQIQNQPMPMDPMLNAIERMQELDSDLSPDDQATLADLFNEDTGSAKTYLALKTDPVRKAWIQRKLKHMRTSALAG